MSTRSERFLTAGVVIVFLFLITLPYVYALRVAGDEYIFGGFLLNPIDGNSYLAKMYEGWRGELRFTLPYTAEKSSGGYLFLLYLSLGQIARIVGESRILLFHLARIIASLLMLASLHRFLTFTLEDHRVKLTAFSIAALGGGLGWIALLFGLFTSDFWVAEGYPFLASFANPHFPLGIALLLYLFTFAENKRPEILEVWWRNLFAPFLLGLVMPFGVILALLVLLGLAVWELYPRFNQFKESTIVRRTFWIFLGGAPVLLYDLWVINQDWLLAIWNAQNKTPSPTLIDLLFSLSPVLLLAIFTLPWAFRSESRNIRLLVVWSLVGLVLLYIPWGLQRRFMMGIFIPLSTLAAIGLGKIAKSARMYTLLTILLILFIIPTNIIVLLASIHGAEKHDNQLYLTKEEYQAYQWIEANTPPDSIILAAPDDGLMIPGYTGRRVFYGHPFETPDAGQELIRVTSFFQSDFNHTNPLLNQADYLFVGPRERNLGWNSSPDMLQVVYKNPQVTVYQVGQKP